MKRSLQLGSVPVLLRSGRSLNLGGDSLRRFVIVLADGPRARQVVPRSGLSNGSVTFIQGLISHDLFSKILE